MAVYRTIVVDASTGKNVADIPMIVNSFSRALSGVGELTGTLPLGYVSATPSVLGGSLGADREITVLRDDVPVWNGPITGLDRSPTAGVATVTAREASWHLSKRVIEDDQHWNADIFYIIRKMLNIVTTKTATGSDGATAGASINAALPRFNVTSGNAGQTMDVAISGDARRNVLDVINAMKDAPSVAFDYRMDYSTGSTRANTQRTLTLGSPSLGTTKTEPLVARLLSDGYSVNSDRERAATRVHIVGSGTTVTRQDTGAVTAGEILTEAVFDKSETSDTTALTNFAEEVRRLSIPPVEVYAASYVPSNALPYGWCDLGDKVSLRVDAPALLAVSDTRRVVQIDVTPPQGGSPELVSLSFNLPLDDLGT